ncbi:hypothetical protein [Candidatus Neptunichlamydia sp. REUL1]|uniref:hypothetical protein n=1 Tax=Candidatus Neptunichlamydia sp. REUL1 TaxID=3064277 RepID=UPI00292E3E06|nr:hypothetical protein [Candidatus Neptunochlamydia sp. REUL1]
MEQRFHASRREVIELLQRKRRYSRSLTDSELRELLKVGNFEKENGMSSEDLLISSACQGASLSIEGRNKVGYTNIGDCENERA